MTDSLLHAGPIIAAPYALLTLAVWLRRTVRRHLKEQP